MSNFELITKICNDIEIKYNFLDNKGMILKKDEKTRYIIGNFYDLNNLGVKMICDNKYLTYKLLSDNEIDCIESHLFDLITDKKNYEIERALDLLNKYKNIVFKSVSGSMGYDIFFVDSKTKCHEIFNYFKNKDINFIVNPFYEILTEFRIVILNNKIELIYKKQRREVIGDGKTTLINLINQDIKFNPFLVKNCLIDQLSLDTVLKKGEKICYSWKDNLAIGAIPCLEIDNKDKRLISKIVNNIISNIEGLNFASIDIIKTQNNDFKVIEINSGVMFDSFIQYGTKNYEIAYNIFEKAIYSMFDMKRENWYVYLISNKRYSYVGATNDTNQRIRKHNGEISGGAKYTKSKGPGWTYVCIISGFKDKINALRFEWAFKNQAPKKAHGLKNRVNKLVSLTWKEKWTESSPDSSNYPLTIKWIKPEFKPSDEVFPNYIKSIV